MRNEEPSELQSLQKEQTSWGRTSWLKMFSLCRPKIHNLRLEWLFQFWMEAEDQIRSQIMFNVYIFFLCAPTSRQRWNSNSWNALCHTKSTNQHPRSSFSAIYKLITEQGYMLITKQSVVLRSGLLTTTRWFYDPFRIVDMWSSQQSKLFPQVFWWERNIAESYAFLQLQKAIQHKYLCEIVEQHLAEACYCCHYPVGTAISDIPSMPITGMQFVEAIAGCSFCIL